MNYPEPQPGQINHSVCRWCYDSIPLETFCERIKELGIRAIDLCTPEEFAVLEKHGLVCSMVTHRQADLEHGFSHTKYHESLIATYLPLIDQAAEHGMPNVIVFSGNRFGISEAAGLENCAVGLDQVVRHAERKDVMVVMELLNSRVDHPDYQCDHTEWGVELVDKVGSPNFKLLYDIYHMQIMEGDIIARIRRYSDYIAHYHTGGVPGRHEINDTQELNYPPIMRAIVETGYSGYVAQEFIPTYDDPIAALREGISICTV